MEHVVFSAAVDGAGEEFRRVSSLEEAVRVVEHLRNDLGIEDATVFSLTPVPLSFRTYYRVEVPGLAPAPTDDITGAPLMAVPSLATDAEPLLPLALLGETPDFDPVPPLEPVAALVSVPSLDDHPAPESLESAADLSDQAVPDDEGAEPPSMPGPGLQPRHAELPGALAGVDSEHSLGYFTR